MKRVVNLLKTVDFFEALVSILGKYVITVLPKKESFFESSIILFIFNHKMDFKFLLDGWSVNNFREFHVNKFIC